MSLSKLKPARRRSRATKLAASVSNRHRLSLVEEKCLPSLLPSHSYEEDKNISSFDSTVSSFDSQSASYDNHSPLCDKSAGLSKLRERLAFKRVAAESAVANGKSDSTVCLTLKERLALQNLVEKDGAVATGNKSDTPSSGQAKKHPVLGTSLDSKRSDATHLVGDKNSNSQVLDLVQGVFRGTRTLTPLNPPPPPPSDLMGASQWATSLRQYSTTESNEDATRKNGRVTSEVPTSADDLLNNFHWASSLRQYSTTDTENQNATAGGGAPLVYSGPPSSPPSLFLARKVVSSVVSARDKSL